MQHTPWSLYSEESVEPAADTLTPRGLPRLRPFPDENTRRTGGEGAPGLVYILYAAFEAGGLDILPSSLNDVLVAPTAVLVAPTTVLAHSHPYLTRPGTRLGVSTRQRNRVPVPSLRRRFVQTRRGNHLQQRFVSHRLR